MYVVTSLAILLYRKLACVFALELLLSSLFLAQSRKVPGSSFISNIGQIRFVNNYLFTFNACHKLLIYECFSLYSYIKSKIPNILPEIEKNNDLLHKGKMVRIKQCKRMNGLC